MTTRPIKAVRHEDFKLLRFQIDLMKENSKHLTGFNHDWATKNTSIFWYEINFAFWTPEVILVFRPLRLNITSQTIYRMAGKAID